ncbi:MAG TPA: ATP-binding protein, partial [Burkholderiaceae bacterium]|nr:ATP-binding protein [Burkholderiaceae bacterium]
MHTKLTLTHSLAHAFFDRHPHAVLVIDARGHVRYANAAAAWLGQDGTYPNFAQLSGQAWPGGSDGQLGLGAGWSRRLKVQAADGSRRQVDASLFAANPSGTEAPLFYCVLCDVTATVAAARADQEVAARSHATSDSGPVLVWMTNLEGRCDWVSNAWLKFRGHTLGEELGDGWTNGVHPEDRERFLGIHANAFEARDAYTLDYRLQRADGVYRWMLATGVPRYGVDGAFLGYIGTCLDITQRKGLEDQLAEYSRTLRLSQRRREDFLAKLSHELRNPLAPIANAAAILRTLEDRAPQLVVVRQIIERQVEQLRRLITDLVDVTRITKGKIVLQRESVDVNALIDGAIEDTRLEFERRQQVLHVARPEPGLTCEGDAHRLTQALAALLANAAKFSPERSTIEVAVQVSQGRVALTVTDPGRGIEPELLPHVFDLFTQGEPSVIHGDAGLGVGLTIARRVAQLHGGDVGIESAGAGQGTEATLRLPLSTGASAGEATLASELAAVAGRRVLIIEDNDDSRDSLRLLMELNGNEVMVAADAAEGLRLAETFVPQLVICDIGLPDLDGFELVHALRDTLAGQATRFVALTGFG